jgi:peptide/nickel transport system ATP-binding protein
MVLEIEDLRTYFETPTGLVPAVDGVSCAIPEGRTLALVGESGCGKSVTALSILRLVPKPGKIVRGQISLFRVRDKGIGHSLTEEIQLTALDPHSREIRAIRGAELAMIFQEPMTSLNPSYTVGDQIMEAILLHQKVTSREAHERAVKILHRVGMPKPASVVKRYPHELSGGMRQRAMIAMALSCAPAVLFADEPTTALDVTTEAQILDLMRELQADMGMTIVFITHNLGVVAQMCDTVAVMYLGRIVEQAPVEELFYSPQHPYSRALLRSIPHVGSRVKARLEPIRGVVPDPYATIKGCPFRPRCDSFRPDLCGERLPALTSVGGAHTVRCFLYSDQGEEEDDR